MKTTRAFALRRRIWRVRRSMPRLARPLSLVLPAAARPERPILVLGCPRSGTTTLLQGLLRSREVRFVQSEGHILWDEFHHPRDRGWASDALGADDVGDRERAYVYRAIALVVRGHRFLDKTPESCLRVPYLDALFPDATFVFLRRGAAENVNSLIEGWKARPRFVKYRLPEPLDGLGALSGDRWSFTLVPGWRELRHAPLEEICACQYMASNEAVLEARSAVAPERWIDLRYEDLVETPVEVLRAVYTQLGLRFGPASETYAQELAGNVSRTALTAPSAEKWREQNPDAIERILPLVQDTEWRLGYRRDS